MATRTPDASRGPLDGATANPRRLVSKAGAAAYLDTSIATIERLINTGAVAIVRLPVQRTRAGIDGDGQSRRVLIDVRDLDRLIDQNKETRGDGAAVPTIVPRRRA